MQELKILEIHQFSSRQFEGKYQMSSREKIEARNWKGAVGSNWKGPTIRNKLCLDKNLTLLHEWLWWSFAVVLLDSTHQERVLKGLRTLQKWWQPMSTHSTQHHHLSKVKTVKWISSVLCDDKFLLFWVKISTDGENQKQRHNTLHIFAPKSERSNSDQSTAELSECEQLFAFWCSWRHLKHTVAWSAT